jgi:hypothetical protein
LKLMALYAQDGVYFILYFEFEYRTSRTIKTIRSRFLSRICNMQQERGQFYAAKQENLQQFPLPFA